MRYFEVRRARIEIIPMIDIMLFLLVFFAMLTLRMIPSSGHLSRLPTSSTAATIPPPKLLIEIHANGQLFMEGRDVDADAVSARVGALDPKHLAVTIAGGGDASLQQVMTVIDAVRKGGGTQIGLATQTTAR
jgi:biopolymer transport protein ExbD